MENDTEALRRELLAEPCAGAASTVFLLVVAIVYLLSFRLCAV